jgi:LacI family transcriptional regulator
MSATLKDVAKKAGVHFSTVSRILRGHESMQVSDETRQRVISVANELNYRPNQLARAFRLKKTHSIGLIIPDMSNCFFSEIAKSIERKCYDAGYMVMVCNTDEDQKKEIEFIDDLLNRGIDGLIIAPVMETKDHIRSLVDRRIPFVLIDRCFEDLESNSVTTDNTQAAYNATTHLISKGHKYIGFVCGRKNAYTLAKRLQGYQKAVSDHSLKLDDSYIVGNGYATTEAAQATQQLLQLPNRPTAIFVSGTKITIGVMKAIREAGLSIPDDISVIGFTDTEFAPYLSPPLTTISHRLNEIGNQAFEILHTQLLADKPETHTRKIVQTAFHQRDSVSTPPKS